MMLKISVRRDRCDHGWDHLGSIHAALANLDHMPISDLQKIRPESPDAAVELALIHLRVMMWKPWQLQNCKSELHKLGPEECHARREPANSAAVQAESVCIHDL